MAIIDELTRRILFLEGIGFREAPMRYAAFLDWLESQPLTSQVLSDLRQKADIEVICRDCSPRKPPNAATPEDVARVGLCFLEISKEEGEKLSNYFIGFGLRSKWGDNSIDGYLENAIDQYIQPFINYLVDSLQRSEQVLHADDLAAFRMNTIFSDDFAFRFPRTALRQAKLSKEFYNLDESGNWFNAANSCRELLKRFTTEIYAVLDEDIPGDTKAGDVKALLKHVVSNRYSSGRTRDSLLALIQSVWDHTQCLLHREETNKEEASRIYLWVTLLISEIHQLSQEASGDE